MAYDTIVLDGEMNVSVVIQEGDRLQDKTVAPTTEDQTVRPDSGFFGLSSVTVTGIEEGSAATPDTAITANPSISVGSDGTITATVNESESITPTVEEGYVSEGTAGTVTVSGNASTQLDTQGAAAITPTESAQTAVAPGKFTTGAVTVKAVPSDYVGSNVPQRDSADLTASGGTVTAPAGYYEEAASKSVQSGTEGAPTASKGAVSNHAVSVTPSVTNTEGYINGGTKTGSPVTVSASELVSGSQTISENGVVDVTNLASVTVNVSDEPADLGEKTVTANGVYNASDDSLDGYSKVTVTVPASAVDSGTKSISTNGTHDVVGYASASVSVPNSYSASDEGKVVSNGALVAQTSDTVTENDTYDTTLINSLTVNVSGGGGTDTFEEYIKGNLTSYSSDNITSIGSNALQSIRLTEINFPNCTSISGNGVYGANVAVAHLPRVETIGNNAFRECALQYIILPSVTSLGSTVFRGQKSNALLAADFGEASMTSKPSLNDSLFYSNSNFNTIILRYDAVVPLTTTNAFNSTPFASGGSGGTVYVPEALISSYQSASNWSTILGYANNQIKKIEGTQYETAYVDGTPIT